MFSSKSGEWETPGELFTILDQVFNFTLDPCATDYNYKCDKYYTIKDDGLSKSWAGETVFVNPPYGRVLKDWIKKCYVESKNATVVILMPARTDTKYQHDYIFKYAKAVCYIKGRLKFENSLVQEITSAPFPSQIAVFAENITDKQKDVFNFLGKLILLK